MAELLVGFDVPQPPQQPAQPAQPAQPVQPAAPRAASSGSLLQQPVPIAGTPQNGAELRAMRSRLEELREQLQDAAARRRTISDQLRSADIAARPGIEARMGELDSRILRLERDITQTGLAITNAPISAVIESRTAPPFPRDFNPRIASKDLIPIVAILSIFVLMPFSVAMSRLIWRRSAAAPRAPSTLDQQALQRLEQLQQSVDTIAIEVERISEGQRFVTRVLNEKPALGAGAAEPIRAAQKSAVPSERG